MDFGGRDLSVKARATPESELALAAAFEKSGWERVKSRSSINVMRRFRPSMLSFS
jgi:hypothetical protein